MRAVRLRMDVRGRVLLPPTLRSHAGLVPGRPLAVTTEDAQLIVRPTETPERRAPTLDRKGRLTLPGVLRAEFGLAPGATLLVRAEPPGLRLATPGGLLTALYLGGATTALAYSLYGLGLRTTPVATAATLSLAEPAVASLLGVAVLGERLAPVSVAGLALLGAGLVVAALPERAGRAREAQSSA